MCPPYAAASVALFFGYVGLCCTVALAPLILILNWTGLDPFPHPPMPIVVLIVVEGAPYATCGCTRIHTPRTITITRAARWNHAHVHEPPVSGATRRCVELLVVTSTV
jgi:hypothetical protein